MIKLGNISTNLYLSKGNLRDIYKDRLRDVMTPAQRLVLTDMEWRARKHPTKSGLVEIFVDPEVLSKNKLLLAQMVFVQ